LYVNCNCSGVRSQESGVRSQNGKTAGTLFYIVRGMDFRFFLQASGCPPLNNYIFEYKKEGMVR
jgi:hypothetical protein